MQTKYTLVLSKQEAREIIQYLGVEIDALRGDVEATEGEEQDSWQGLLDIVVGIRDLIGDAAVRASPYAIVNLPDDLYGILYESMLYHDIDLEASAQDVGAQA